MIGDPKPAKSWGRILRASGAVLLACTLIIGGWVGYMRLTGNIHEIVPGKVYRSAQLSPNQLSQLIHDKGLRTVINLRGLNPHRQWFSDEVRVTEQAGARHVSVPLSANHEPSDALIKQLLDVLSTAQTPFVIHCEAGADRTGLAAALYQAVVMKQSPETAEQQLSLRYGHFPWLTSRTGAMDRTFERVVGALPSTAGE